MPKNKRNRKNEIELEEIEDHENGAEEQAEVEEQALSAEPWSRPSADVGDAPTAHVQGDWENEQNFPLSDDTVSDFIEVGSDPEAVLNEMQQYTLDIEVQEDFEERQNMVTNADAMEEDLVEITHQSPKLSGGDVDAAWDYTDQSGEESVGASVPTPDQDVVDELGEALGVTYDDDEELNTAEKLGERDLNRWELNPASAVDMEVENAPARTDDPIGLVGEHDMELEKIENELDELLEEEGLEDLEDEFRDADLDPLDLEDEDLDDFDEEDLELFEDDDFEELDDEGIL
jgi:hypothetical protein